MSLTLPGSGLPLTQGLPIFSAYQNAAQALSAGVAAKATLQAEEFDSNNFFDNVTNYRFQPTIAGYYDIKGAMAIASTATTCICLIYKNGAEFKRGATASGSGNATVAALVQLNGSTDYIEMWIYSAVAQNTAPGASFTWFQGLMVRVP
jgi:hypothetical protein